MKWKAPTRSVMPRHEQSTASRPSANVSSSMISVRPSAARKKLMPSEPIQVAWTWAIQDPAMRPEGPAPLAAKAACRALAFAIHCATRMTSGIAVPATAVQRASAGLRRASSQAMGAATVGIRM